VTFTLAHAGRATLGVYAVNGRLVRTLADGLEPAGVHHLTWDGRSTDGRFAAAGVYYLRLSADGRLSNRSLVLLR
jgi:flagellar hook assembly protein FlgD